jgi:hypothetical protein
MLPYLTINIFFLSNKSLNKEETVSWMNENETQ